MINVPKYLGRAGSPSLVWPDTGTSTPSAVGAVFGGRPFAAHIGTVGYDYDMHRGADVAVAAGGNVYSVMAGVVTRLHRTHYGFQNAAQGAYWVEVDPGSTGVFTIASNALNIAGTRGGAKTFPTTSANYKALSERVDISTGDWEMRFKLKTAPTLVGGVVGFGIYDEANTAQVVALETNGSTATVVGVGSGGAMAANGTTASTAVLYYSITYTQATDTIVWRYSSDAITWTTAATQATVAFTREGVAAFTPTVYWRSTDTNAAVQTVDVAFVGWWDNNNIGRFGNWVTIVGNDGNKVCQMHFQELFVNNGQVVEAGQLIGLAGSTGFDTRSGFVTTPHVHVEYIQNNRSLYNQDEPINPLAPSLLPRTNTNANVACTRTTANDPDAVSCWKLAIVVTRGGQDFDLNSVTLTANLATRTINFNTRAGLNADNDIPKQAGVYIVPSAFTTASSSYNVDIYFSKAVVGSTFTSLSIADTAGTVLYSE